MRPDRSCSRNDGCKQNALIITDDLRLSYILFDSDMDAIDINHIRTLIW